MINLKRKIFFVFLVVLLMVGSILPAFAAHAGGPEVVRPDDGLMNVPGDVTIDIIQGNFVVNLQRLKDIQIPYVMEYAEYDAADGDFRLAIEFPDFGAYISDLGDSDMAYVNSFSGDQMVIYFEYFSGNDRYVILESWYLANSETSEYIQIYNVNTSDDDYNTITEVDYIFFEFPDLSSDTSWKSWGSNLTTYANAKWSFGEIKTEIAQWLFGTNIDDGTYNFFWMTYPYSVDGPIYPDDSGGGIYDDPSEASDSFFDFVINCFGRLMDISFFGGWFTLGSIVGIVLAFAALKLFISYFAGG